MLFAALTICFTAFAQLPDGSEAPDFTATDIDGNEWNLYQLLDEGKTVILDFSATWCGPCWSYAQSGILEDLYSTFGPNGTDDIMIFYLESDDTTTAADLNGTGAATTGDWVSITNFPIIDNASNIFDSYSNTYYPTIYTVCPNRTLVESGQGTFDQHVNAAFTPCANSVSGAAPLMSYNGDSSACGGGDWTASIEVENIGSETVSNMTFEVTINGSSQPDVNWNGNISNGSAEVIELGSYTEIGTLDITLSSVNGSDWEAHSNVDIVGSVEASTSVQVRIQLDNWPEETGWSIQNANGEVVIESPVGSYGGMVNELITTDVELDLNECYTFTMIDTYGDGLYASQWGDYADGYAQIVSMDGTTELGMVLDYQGSSGFEFAELVIGMEAISPEDIVNIHENEEIKSSIVVYPNPFNGNTNLEFTTPETADAYVVVYNLIGEKVIDMNLGSVSAGTQNIQLDFSSVKTGIYLLSLTAGSETSTLRVTKTH